MSNRCPGEYATSVYSGNGSLIASQNELGFLTSFILDAASQRICVVDANNGRSTTIFSNRGYVSATQDQLGVFTSFTQDPNGNNILRVDARNWPTTYTIDALNRTAQTLYVGSTRVTNTWDAAGQQIVSADSTGITSLVWDKDSRKIATQNPTGINLTSTLDRLGNRLLLQDKYGSTSYTWDSQSRLLSIWNPLNERTTMLWDALDREQHRVLANGGTISHTWDSAGREILIENRNAVGVGQFIATNTYSAVDNRLTVVELDSTLCTFGYDASRQIISEARSGTYAYARSYVWDGLGNRLQQYDNGLLTTSTFNKANQLLAQTPTSGTATVSSYDKAGNLIGMNCGGALTTQTWSAENRLASYADAEGNNEQFLYSNDGLKKKRVNGSATTLFTYDEAALLLETDASLNLDARHTNAPETWGGLASQNRSGVSSFYGFDSQMSARILVSIAGLITDVYSWKVFGEPIQSGSGTVNPYGYIANGLYYTELADLINAWNNWLKASVGRWDSRDKLGFDGGSWNPYEYVANNPVNHFDPTGLQQGDGPNNTCGTCAGDGYNPDRHSKAQAAIDSLCKAITPADMGSGFGSAVDSCVAAATAGGSIDCGKDVLGGSGGGYSCLQQFCNGQNGAGVSCLDTGCGNYNVGGYASQQGNTRGTLSPDCSANICIDHTHSNGIDKSIDRDVGTLLHEMLHCGGVSHGLYNGKQIGPKEGGYTCNEILVCCIINQLRKQKNYGGARIDCANPPPG